MTTQLTLDLRNESYRNLEQIGNKQRQVYDAIKDLMYWQSVHGYNLLGASNKLIAEYLGWPINCVTGRTNELMKKGMIEIAGKEYDYTTDRKVTIFKTK